MFHINPGGSGDYQYYVHYQGWNKNWDEWVNESRILKMSPENIDKKHKLLTAHNASVKEAKKKGAAAKTKEKEQAAEAKQEGKCGLNDVIGVNSSHGTGARSRDPPQGLGCGDGKG